MARLNNKMKASPKAKNMNVAFWGKKTFTEKAREDSNLKIGLTEYAISNKTGIIKHRQSNKCPEIIISESSFSLNAKRIENKPVEAPKNFLYFRQS